MADDKFRELMDNVEKTDRAYDKIVDEINQNGSTDALREKLSIADKKEKDARKKLDEYMKNRK